MIIIFLLLVILVLCIYYYLTRNYNYWKNQNVPSDPNVVPGFGHLLPMFLLRENIGTLLKRLYARMGSSSMYGCYFMQTPALVIRDPELIRSVLERNFQNFRNNLKTLDRGVDPIAALNTFFAKDEIWKESRSLLAYNFSGAKLRFIFMNLMTMWNKMDNYIERRLKTQDKNNEFELQDLCRRALSEIISNSAFGIDGESFEDMPHQSSFFSMAQRMFIPNAFPGVSRALRYLLPNLANYLGIRYTSKENNMFIRYHLRNIIQSVANNPGTIKDLYQFSIDKVDKVEEDFIMAQSSSIVYDGYESVSSALSFTLYRLAMNTTIQEKARREVNQVFDESDGTLTFESLKNLAYLDLVILEALRMNPVFDDITKTCNEEITLQGSDGLSCRLRPGDFVLISPDSLHMDEEYWPNPSIFDPDRFSSENKKNINRYAYLGFSEGPRSCPGKRMSITIIKSVTALILRNYSLIISKKSEGPLKKNPTIFGEVIEGGLWVQLNRLRM